MRHQIALAVALLGISSMLCLELMKKVGRRLEEQQKKKDLYVFRAGSCFVHPFAGDIYDVSDGGSHPVYRYARAMFLGV